MWKDVLSSFKNDLPISILSSQPELVEAIQGALIDHGHLDPPVDGTFGPVTHGALEQFCYMQGLSLGAGFTKAISNSLENPSSALPEIKNTGTWIDFVISYMKDKKFFISRIPGSINIFYVEGCNLDGKQNNDAPNLFNDIRGVFWLDASGATKSMAWEGTTEPGLYWTQKPLSSSGAARIAFGQYKAWQVGKHLASKPSGHLALVQTGAPVKVCRDLNKDYSRKNDKIYEGFFGINQHWGYDMPLDDLGQSSAGCLVGRTKSGHKEFMKIIMSDSRYMKNQSYKFYTTILPHPKSKTD